MRSSKGSVFMGRRSMGSLLLLIALVASTWTVQVESSAAATTTITVMTRNLYLGAALDPLLNAPTPDAIPQLVADIYAAILSSQFPCRAEAIADEIVQSQPDVVGLQEAVLLRVTSPCGASIPNPPQPTAFAIDYLQILVDALERRGAHYSVATQIMNTDVTVSDPSGQTLRLTDRDALLVRTDAPSNIRVSTTQAENFETRFSVQIGGAGGPSLTVLRGWCSADLKVGGKLVRVVNTHLEEASPIIQTIQANELLAGPLHTSRPVISLGDFNGSVGSNTYGVFLDGGFQDAWTLAHASDTGFSCCQAPDLLNPMSQLNTRIDLVLFHSKRISVNDVQLVGADPADRLASGLWPSDHAGVVGLLSIK